ncbi:MAG TPA: hypothetical protein VHT27_12500 [Solirubrobacteraceae bacterium]|jgi:hypothetical protein|nr:hypothetical protein [Solirubrobacteraceae bacterium]
MATIAERASHVKASAGSRLSEPVVAAFATEQPTLEKNEVPARAVSIGDTLALFALPDAGGEIRTLVASTVRAESGWESSSSWASAVASMTGAVFRHAIAPADGSTFGERPSEINENPLQRR